MGDGDIEPEKRDFIQGIFTNLKKGAELAEELLRDNERLRQEVKEHDAANALLRAQLASDAPMREALRQIERLESEKHDLVSRADDAAATSERFSARFDEMEQELADLANLYVASHQLHSTLDLNSVVRHLRELLVQLVGVRAHAVYLWDADLRQLVPVACDGVDLATLPAVDTGTSTGDPPEGAAGVIERVFLTGVPQIPREAPADPHPVGSAPVACVPLKLGDRVTGVVVIYELLAQKKRFSSLDFALLELLGAHAGTALTAALLYADARGKLPGLDSLRHLEPRVAGAKF